MQGTDIMRLIIATALFAAMPSPALGQATWTREAQIAGAADPIQAERYRSLPTQRPWPTRWFQPRETVRGAVRARRVPVASRRTISPEAIAAASAYAMKDSQALLIWRDGRLEHAEYGLGAQPSDELNSYYMHFPVLSLLYGVAIKERKIGSIDDPVGKYLAEWRNDPRGRITLRDLLNMQAGLETYHDSPDPKSRAARLFMGADSTTPIFEFPAVEQPGRSFAYNYMVPEILGLALERAVGIRYADYLSSRLWRPLRNADASVWLDRPGGRPHFNSSLFATAEDWLNVGRLILDNGRVGPKQVVPASWIATMKTPSSTNPNYGMLWLGSPYQAVRSYAKDVGYKVNASAPFAAADLIYLDGYGGQRVYIVPSKKLVIVRIGTTRRDWDDAALPNAVLAGIP
jgi:hypothetical protein